MKRDLDLCRAILMGLEEHEQPGGWIDLVIHGHSTEEVSYHVRLLAEAGLIEALDATTHAGSLWKPKRLTWTGHEFLDAARNDGVWHKAKSIVLEKTGTLTLDLLRLCLSELTKGLLSGKITPL